MAVHRANGFSPDQNTCFSGCNAVLRAWEPVCLDASFIRFVGGIEAARPLAGARAAAVGEQLLSFFYASLLLSLLYRIRTMDAEACNQFPRRKIGAN
jgi:hypothetical protein